MAFVPAALKELCFCIAGPKGLQDSGEEGPKSRRKEHLDEIKRSNPAVNTAERKTPLWWEALKATASPGLPDPRLWL